MNVRQRSKFGGIYADSRFCLKIKWMITYILNFYIIIGIFELIYFTKENLSY